MKTVRGHNRAMQTFHLESGGAVVFGFADLIPTRAHLPPAWIMSYDLFPTETLEAKKNLILQALDEDWICHFYHDFELPLGRLTKKEGKVLAREFFPD